MHSCLHDGMWALHELAWHAGTFVASHNLATAWHRVCNDVTGLGRHAKAILCMGGIHVSAVLPACMPPPIMGASKASNRLRSKFLRGGSHIRPFQPLFIDDHPLVPFSQSAVRSTPLIDSLINIPSPKRPQNDFARNSFGGGPLKGQSKQLQLVAGFRKSF